MTPTTNETASLTRALGAVAVIGVVAVGVAAAFADLRTALGVGIGAAAAFANLWARPSFVWRPIGLNPSPISKTASWKLPTN